jgi:phosphoribosylaminoimidazolecarboxamide formyltransferase/IMP cyclohydrolase
MSDKSLKQMYFTRTEGEFPDTFEMGGVKYQKIENLRYGTNPHQAAAFYRPTAADALVLGDFRILKQGKSGLSQTNLEDISYSLNIIKYLDVPACAVMKHVNPSGVAYCLEGETQKDVYIKARDCDPLAAFGSVVGFNTQVSVDTAKEIMTSVVEAVVAPDFETGALDVFMDWEQFKRNREIRIIEVKPLDSLPKYKGESKDGLLDVKVLADGSIVLSEKYLTKIKSAADLMLASTDHEKKGAVESARRATEQELKDLVFAWYVNINVRSNGVVIAKNGTTLAVGTGQQDRVGAVKQALEKYEEKYKGKENIKGAVMASDGFFPFRDAVDAATRVGIAAILQPGGSVADFDAINAANEAGAAMYFTGERCFSHH